MADFSTCDLEMVLPPGLPRDRSPSRTTAAPSLAGAAAVRSPVLREVWEKVSIGQAAQFREALNLFRRERAWLLAGPCRLGQLLERLFRTAGGEHEDHPGGVG